MSIGQIEAIKKLVDRDLAGLVSESNSWHSQYRNSAYIYVGNLDPRLTEGDIVTVFSQFGDIVDINLSRDKITGKSMGFCFIAFENQKSTILAIDNMIGYVLLGRPIRIDHVSDYKPPRRYVGEERVEYTATGAEGHGIGVYNVTESQKNLTRRLKTHETITLSADQEEELWAKQFEEQIKNEIKQEPR